MQSLLHPFDKTNLMVVRKRQVRSAGLFCLLLLVQSVIISLLGFLSVCALKLVKLTITLCLRAIIYK